MKQDCTQNNSYRIGSGVLGCVLLVENTKGTDGPYATMKRTGEMQIHEASVLPEVKLPAK